MSPLLQPRIKNTFRWLHIWNGPATKNKGKQIASARSSFPSPIPENHQTQMSIVCAGSHRRQTVCYIPSVHALLQLLNSRPPNGCWPDFGSLPALKGREGRRCPAATLLSFRKWGGCLAANLSVQISPLCRPYQMNPNVKTFYISIALQGRLHSFQNK